jgi:hypothetical protein
MFRAEIVQDLELPASLANFWKADSKAMAAARRALSTFLLEYMFTDETAMVFESITAGFN